MFEDVLDLQYSCYFLFTGVERCRGKKKQKAIKFRRNQEAVIRIDCHQ